MKEDVYKSVTSGRKDFVETTGPFPEILIGNSYWIGVVDDYSRYSWSFFTEKINFQKIWKSFLRR